MKVCAICGEQKAVKFARLERHCYDLMGVKVELIDSAYAIFCKACGKESFLIPDHEGLVAATAVTRAHIPTKLNAIEIKFFRKAVGCKAREMAAVLDVTAETLSRWEGGSVPIGPKPEKLLRLYVADTLIAKAPAVDCDYAQIFRMDINPIRGDFDSKPMRFELVRIKSDKEKKPSWDSMLDAIAA